ncbi:MAG: glucoamylase family protein, partial [Burkholderiales bacterium]
LNRARYDEAKQRVTEGYGILQPRVAISLPGVSRSRYARLYGGEPGIDPYTRAVSDVYQDIFGEGSFIGKGIYDVDAFELALKGRFPENLILSHDLIEGCYARSGLLSDVYLYEDYPASYADDVNRRYRWIRGDWQLMGWLLRHVPGGHANPLSRLSQWKLFDNLRRSLVPAALTLLFMSGWVFLSPAWLWTLFPVGIMLVPALCVTLLDLFRKSEEVLLKQHLLAVSRATSRRLIQVVFELSCLPFEAAFSLDAIARTVWRMVVTGRGLLEWNPSSAAALKSPWKSFRAMGIAPVLAIALSLYLAALKPAVLIAAGPILLLWFAAPVTAWWLSRLLVHRKATLKAEQLLFLRGLSRQTWAFFETHVGLEDHGLPPDNVQEYRSDPVAHRTSPTNMGLALLANLSAYDFGYIPAGRLVVRTADAFHTMNRLQRHLGHFYNWYDTQTLQPMLPLYISTVDSGNLAGHLLTLRAGLRVLADDRILGTQLFEGLGDTCRILAAAMDQDATPLLSAFRRDLEAALVADPKSLAALHLHLLRLEASAATLTKCNFAPQSEAFEWAQTLVRQVGEALEELTFLIPWIALPPPSSELEAFAALATVPTLRALGRLDADLSAMFKQHEGFADMERCVAEGSTRARDRMAVIEGLIAQSGDLANMRFDFLFDRARHLLTIGYNVDERRLDSGYYDLLASEARLCSFVGIAQGQLPQESWFALGRILTNVGGEPVLLSWSGSMFEYLMPLLVMPTYDNTLLDQTCKAAVARQIEYGKQSGLPWGISESGYNTLDVHLNYQYRAFGVPGLGLKRGLAEDMVVAPYASTLALMVAPEEACLNLQRLSAEGFVGRFGLFEAIDYTPTRQRRGQFGTVIRSYMAHHQGMSLLALAYLLLDRPMQRRFESERMFQAIMPLLQERIPKATTLLSHAVQLSEIRSISVASEIPIRTFNTPDTPVPEVQLLSNGRYHVMVTNAGGGYSRWRDIAVMRWREDSTSDNWGTFCY